MEYSLTAYYELRVNFNFNSILFYCILFYYKIKIYINKKYFIYKYIYK